MPKAVISTNRQFLTNLMNTGIGTLSQKFLVVSSYSRILIFFFSFIHLAGARGYLRNGEEIPAMDMTEQKALLLVRIYFSTFSNTKLLYD